MPIGYQYKYIVSSLVATFSSATTNLFTGHPRSTSASTSVVEAQASHLHKKASKASFVTQVFAWHIFSLLFISTLAREPRIASFISQTALAKLLLAPHSPSIAPHSPSPNPRPASSCRSSREPSTASRTMPASLRRRYTQNSTPTPTSAHNAITSTPTTSAPTPTTAPRLRGQETTSSGSSTAAATCGPCPLRSSRRRRASGSWIGG